MLRSLKSVVVGVGISAVIFMIITVISRFLYPRPQNIALDDKEGFTQFLQNQPIGEQLFISLSFIISALVGTYIASRMSDRYRFWIGIGGGCFILMVCISIFLYIPYPKSYAGITILSVMASMVIGAFLGSRTMPKV
jgi:MFS family permease